MEGYAKSNYLSCSNTCLNLTNCKHTPPYFIAGTIALIAGLVILGLGASGQFGPLGSSGFSALVGSGGAVALGALAVIISIAVKNCKVKNENSEKIIKNPSIAKPLATSTTLHTFENDLVSYRLMQSKQYSCLVAENSQSFDLSIWNFDKNASLHFLKLEKNEKVKAFEYPYILIDSSPDSQTFSHTNDMKIKAQNSYIMNLTSGKKINYDLENSYYVTIENNRSIDVLLRSEFFTLFFSALDTSGGSTSMPLPKKAKGFFAKGDFFYVLMDDCIKIYNLADEGNEVEGLKIDTFDLNLKIDDKTSLLATDKHLFMSNNHGVHIWNLTNKSFIKSISFENGPWTLRTFEMPYLAISNDKEIQVWYIATNELHKTLNIEVPSDSPVVLHDNKLVMIQNSEKSQLVSIALSEDP